MKTSNVFSKTSNVFFKTTVCFYVSLLINYKDLIIKMIINAAACNSDLLFSGNRILLLIRLINAKFHDLRISIRLLDIDADFVGMDGVEAVNLHFVLIRSFPFEQLVPFSVQFIFQGILLEATRLRFGDDNHADGGILLQRHFPEWIYLQKLTF